MAVTVPDYVLTVERPRLGGFFLLFSRFEFALKACGYVRANRYGGAEVDWEKFAQQVEERVLPPKGHALAAAIAYLEENPPKQQVPTGNTLTWAARPAPKKYSRARALLFYVLGARNNLMHGAKFLSKEATDPDRDRKLLEASEFLIEACLADVPGLLNAFDSEAL